MTGTPDGELALRVHMMPKDTNAFGTIFGGVILSLIDQAAFVEHQHPRAGEERPGEREELTLTGRQRHAPLVARRVELQREAGQQAVEPDRVAGLEQLDRLL